MLEIFKLRFTNGGINKKKCALAWAVSDIRHLCPDEEEAQQLDTNPLENEDQQAGELWTALRGEAILAVNDTKYRPFNNKAVNLSYFVNGGVIKAEPISVEEENVYLPAIRSLYRKVEGDSNGKDSHLPAIKYLYRCDLSEKKSSDDDTPLLDIRYLFSKSDENVSPSDSNPFYENYFPPERNPFDPSYRPPESNPVGRIRATLDSAKMTAMSHAIFGSPSPPELNPSEDDQQNMYMNLRHMHLRPEGEQNIRHMHIRHESEASTSYPGKENKPLEKNPVEQTGGLWQRIKGYLSSFWNYFRV
ncbi:hypothetical protein [Candidatus Regiella insecticola]|uniref:hypothetical protein n=1 Tax=Candidatus Regiella insecticola TaxID=138073 RepID=UPI0012FF1BF5|nr:hypothetical protein [Candidatus Regiella insecticola]